MIRRNKSATFITMFCHRAIIFHFIIALTRKERLKKNRKNISEERKKEKYGIIKLVENEERKVKKAKY